MTGSKIILTMDGVAQTNRQFQASNEGAQLNKQKCPGRGGIMSKARLASALVIAVLAAPAASMAQTAPGGLEVVVVTAERRAENVQDVPIAITAVSGKQLHDAGITSTNQLSNVVPGLNFVVQGAYAQPTIRGIGTTVTGAGADANVSLYVGRRLSAEPARQRVLAERRAGHRGAEGPARNAVRPKRDRRRDHHHDENAGFRHVRLRRCGVWKLRAGAGPAAMSRPGSPTMSRPTFP